MDNKPLDRSMSSQKGWPVVLWLSEFLSQPEREAVLGDLIENGDSPGRAIANVFGLVVRRQTAVLSDLRLWRAVAFVVLPVSYLLSAIAENTAGEGAVYSWMYLNNWDWALTRNPGFWHVLRETAMNFGVTCLVLACWSWSAGFLIGRSANAVLQTSRNAFIVLLAASFVGDAPGRLIHFWWPLHGLPLALSLPDTHAPITANIFYRVFFPLIVLAILVVVPAFSGMHQGYRSLLLEWKMRASLVAAAIISVLIMLIQVPGFGLLVSATAREWLGQNPNAIRALSLSCCWPTFYFIAIAFRRYRRRKAAMAQ
jgi:hypothetical protein